MLIPESAWRALLDAGVRLRQINYDTVEIWLESDDRRYPVQATVVTRPRSVGPAEVRRLAHAFGPRSGHVLLTAPRINADARSLLSELGWSWIVAASGQPVAAGVLVLPDQPRLHIGTGEAAEPPPPSASPGKVPWGTFALMRLLLTGASGGQGSLAQLVGLSQPRVSQILKELQADGFVGRFGESPQRWAVGDWDGLLAKWLVTYPGPGGVTTYWYGLDSVEEQVVAALRELETRLQGSGRAPVVSGDAAADQMSPWRRPQRAVIYSEVGADLAHAGLTPSGPEEATLALVVPEDPSVWPADSEWLNRFAPGAPFPLADPVQVIWDLTRATGADRDQAADALRGALRAHVAAERSL